jgi:hypothetical protein
MNRRRFLELAYRLGAMLALVLLFVACQPAQLPPVHKPFPPSMARLDETRQIEAMHWANSPERIADELVIPFWCGAPEHGTVYRSLLRLSGYKDTIWRDWRCFLCVSSKKTPDQICFECDVLDNCSVVFDALESDMLTREIDARDISLYALTGQDRRGYK